MNDDILLEVMSMNSFSPITYIILNRQLCMMSSFTFGTLFIGLHDFYL